jgi:hypothetical protein
MLTDSKRYIPDAFEGTHTSDDCDLALELTRTWSRCKVRLNPGEAHRGVLVMLLW